MTYVVGVLAGLASIAGILQLILLFAQADEASRERMLQWTKTGANAILTITMTLGAAVFLVLFFLKFDAPMTRGDLLMYSGLVANLILWPMNWLLGKDLAIKKARLAQTLALNKQLEKMMEANRKDRDDWEAANKARELEMEVVRRKHEAAMEASRAAIEGVPKR